MNRSVLSVKEETTIVNLLADLSIQSKIILQERKKQFKWLQFAEFAAGAYHFQENKNEQWETLEYIAKATAPRHAHFHIGQIVDILSELVNTRVRDSLIQQQKYNDKHLLIEEKKFINLQLLDLADSPYYIPRYPWMMPVQTIKKSIWIAKDLSYGKLIQIRKTKKGKYYEYLITNDFHSFPLLLKEG